jgi:hypothetical protein
MEPVNLGDGLVVVGLDERGKQVLLARKAFTEQYCKEKGWPAPRDLTIKQVLEIRSQEKWKNPLGELQ